MTNAMNHPLHIHLIGIGGSGLSAIARLLLESGYTVSGSDRTLSPLAQELAQAGAQVYSGHRAENIRGADLVVRSSAVTDDNVEVAAARAAGIPVLKRAQFLGRLMEGQQSIAVAGTHGKTTTTAMITWCLTQAGLDPSYIIGGTAKNLNGRNAHAGKGGVFTIEADEYDRMFLGLNPDLIVISYLEHDHPDCYPTPEDYFAAFVAFIHRLKPGGTLLTSFDQPAAHQLAASAPEGVQVWTYGTHPEANYAAQNLRGNAAGGFDFEAVWRTGENAPVPLAMLHLQVPGEHNVRNSLSALAAVHCHALKNHLDVQPVLQAAAQALSTFSGTGRRFDLRGEVEGITVIDDYAHHPTEIQATLAAARARYPQRRIWALWQPHTFSRTRTLMDAFCNSFQDADQVIVTEVYAAREQAQDFDNFSAAQVVQHMAHPAAQFIPTLTAAGDALLQALRPGDVLLVLSAGDADQVSARILQELPQAKQVRRP